MNRKMVFYTIGQMLITEAVLLLLPTVVSVIYGEGCISAFLITIGIALVLGGLLVFLCRTKNQVIYAKEGFITVSLVWIAMSLVGALPFYISGEIPSYIDALFETLGKVDLCLTGVGINGHIAFNEPPKATDAITDEEYKNCGTRCADIATETVVNNGANKLRGALDIFPKRCITLGMKQLLKARVLKVYLYCNWQWGIMRKMALEDESRFMPVSFLQSHPNAEMVITQSLYEFNL